MENRKYYSLRTKKSGIKLDDLRALFLATYQDLEEEGYFQEYFGFWCVDASAFNNWIEGKIGTNPNNYILRKTRKKNLWPIDTMSPFYPEEDLFDIIELLFDHISEPIPQDTDYHGYNQCGWHYKNFDKEKGQARLSKEVNEFLRDYGEGFELNDKGEIIHLPDPNFKKLLDAKIPKYKDGDIEGKIEEATKIYWGRKSTIRERENAVRILADCLEFLRPKLKEVITKKDEDDLFNIANNFAIRHHNTKQKTNYDKNIWLSWMFYFYLATLHAGLRYLEKKNQK
jgi:hypothetical protein